MEIGVYEAKTHFAALLERVQRGERITITKRGKAVAELRPAASPDSPGLQEALARLDARRRSRPAGREPLTIAEIVAAKDEGRR
ncbi:MAG: type II toxin-antitoxin system Phd/YefM family antitoxin [Solimonas sp.]